MSILSELFPPAPPLPPDLVETNAGARMQALIASGFQSLRVGEYLLLQITDPAATRRWLTALLNAPRLVGSVNEVQARGQPQLDEVVAVGVSHAGLDKLGVAGLPEHGFPTTFQRGMSDPLHAQALGDADLDRWRWRWRDTEGTGSHCAHLLVVHYWKQGSTPDARLSPTALQAAGLAVHRVRADPDFIRDDGRACEPFGFRDGLAQPVIRGLRDDRTSRHRDIQNLARPDAADLLVAAGEFVLGYPNEYDQVAYAPDVAGFAAGGARGQPRFGSDGSYIAVRQIRQDVQAFLDFEALVSLPPRQVQGQLAPTIAERMVGRRRDGGLLTPGTTPSGAREAFRYRLTDQQGFGCPRGAHVRRANPRDSLAEDIGSGLALSKLHRLLRRGRSYIERGDGGTAEQGMFFIALNADIDRQFAFVQSQWIASPSFGELFDESDPLLGTRGSCFTVQDERHPLHYAPLPKFTEVLGGGYFFLPSLPALRFLAGLP